MRLPINTLLALCLLSPTAATAGDILPEDSWQWLEQQLATATSLHVHEMPLNQVIHLLEEQTGLQMIIDKPAFDDMGLAVDEPVTVSLESVPLNTMLELAFRELELTWTLRDKVIMITSEEEALTQLYVRVYLVDDLLEVVDGYQDYDSLIDVIISTVESDSWVENGGPEADIRPLASSNALVISQTLQTHLLIEQLLADIRSVRQRQGLPGAKATPAVGQPAPRRAPRRTYYQPASSAHVPRAYE